MQRRWPWLLFLAIALLSIVHVAWICDDAFISARVAENFVSGRGLRWNPSERVQAFTHPLWLGAMILSRLIIHDAYWSLLALSVGVSAAVLALVVRSGERPEPFAAAIAGTLVLSKSFVDFSSSGLENPLTHLLLLMFWLELTRGRSFVRASLWTGLALLNRLDLALIFVPALLAFARERRPRASQLARAVLVALGPLGAWELFSLAYYGLLVPNTALAKLGSALPRGELLGHGVALLLQPVWNDPTTLLLMFTGLPLGLARGTSTMRALCAGALIYVGYVVWIGGDFMAGRFFSAPVLIAVLALLRLLPVPPRPLQLGLAGVAVVLQVVPLTPTFAAPLREASVAELSLSDTCLDGVCNERAFYGPYTGWRRSLTSPVRPPHPWSFRGLEWSSSATPVRVAGAIGFRGFFAGPGVTVIDYFGLSEPLLARLPHDPRLHEWKPGHLRRCLPRGFLEAVVRGPSALPDPALRAYYEKIWRVTRDPLWSRERWRAILDLNLRERRYTAHFECRAVPKGDATLSP